MSAVTQQYQMVQEFQATLEAKVIRRESSASHNSTSEQFEINLFGENFQQQLEIVSEIPKRESSHNYNSSTNEEFGINSSGENFQSISAQRHPQNYVKPELETVTEIPNEEFETENQQQHILSKLSSERARRIEKLNKINRRKRFNVGSSTQESESDQVKEITRSLLAELNSNPLIITGPESQLMSNIPDLSAVPKKGILNSTDQENPIRRCRHDRTISFNETENEYHTYPEMGVSARTETLV